jgi:Ca2+/H+ antiporter, TMEM165/GDT1 family
VNPWVLAGTTFAASSVEFVEAATIVLAVAVTHGWRAATTGALWAAVALVALVGVGTPILTSAVSLSRLELIVGPFLVLFGIAWLRKAVWRFAGRKALHDESAIFARERERLRERGRHEATAVAFQGVFVEGLEVAVVVVTFGAASPHLMLWSAGGALLAFIAVTSAAVVLRAPFSRVPENVLKSIVGIMLTSLGTFWTGEGLQIRWWYGDATLAVFVLAAIVLASSLTYVQRACPA